MQCVLFCVASFAWKEVNCLIPVSILLPPPQVLSINSAFLFLPVVALCKLLAGNRRSLGCESPIDFGKRRVPGYHCSPAPLSFCAFVAPSTNVLWSLFSSHHWFGFILAPCPVCPSLRLLWIVVHWCVPKVIHRSKCCFGHSLINTQAATKTAVWCCKLTRIISH